MVTLKLTKQQICIVSAALHSLHEDAKFGASVNTNYYGNHRSLDNETTGEELQNEIDQILNMEAF